MKRLLSGLAAFTLIASTATSAVACQKKDKGYVLPELNEEKYTNMFHVQNPTQGMMNDIQGGFYDEKNDLWHIYFLQNAEGRFDKYGYNHGGFGSIWYHVTTRDFVNWEYHGPAVPNIEHYSDSSSGSFYVDVDDNFGYQQQAKDNGFDNAIIAIPCSYSDYGQTMMMYYSIDGGYTFLPIKDTAVLVNPNEKENGGNFRDPYFFTSKDSEGNTKYIIYMAEQNYFGVYVSDKPTEGYKRVGKVTARYPKFECPNLYQMNVTDENGKIEQKWVMFYGGVGSDGKQENDPALSFGTYYAVGHLDENFVFVEENPGPMKRIDFGPDYYGANFWKKSFVNTNVDSLYTVGWINSWDYNWSTPNDGRLGIMSLVREISLKKNGNDYSFETNFVNFWDEDKVDTNLPKGVSTVSELKNNNTVEVAKKQTGTTTNEEKFLEKNGYDGKTFKLDLDLNKLSNQDSANVKIGDDKYNVALTLDFKNNTVSVKRKQDYKFAMGQNEFNATRTYKTNLDLNAKLEVFIDRNVVEYKFPDGKVFTMLKYPIGAQEEELSVSSTNNSEISFDYYQLQWKPRTK
ncbi:levanase [Spiroplasma chinense]|uniref:Levanase n=1 Tax=Spiroplasma chinense TaxID=216932 RepID=A0A5B9Y6N8_9MOLU|nr:GH32 C-terminal domain-containing protein [Spiroplasma chinense]QEH61927.1 levanase [Spiroplasma chinense]